MTASGKDFVDFQAVLDEQYRCRNRDTRKEAEDTSNESLAKIVSRKYAPLLDRVEFDPDTLVWRLVEPLTDEYLGVHLDALMLSLTKGDRAVGPQPFGTAGMKFIVDTRSFSSEIRDVLLVLPSFKTMPNSSQVGFEVTYKHANRQSIFINMCYRSDEPLIECIERILFLFMHVPGNQARVIQHSATLTQANPDHRYDWNDFHLSSDTAYTAIFFYDTIIDTLVLRMLSALTRGHNEQAPFTVAEMSAGEGRLAKKILRSEQIEIQHYTLFEFDNHLVELARQTLEPYEDKSKVSQGNAVDLGFLYELRDPRVDVWIASGSVLTVNVGGGSVSPKIKKDILSEMNNSLIVGGLIILTGWEPHIELSNEFLDGEGLVVVNRTVPGIQAGCYLDEVANLTGTEFVILQKEPRFQDLERMERMKRMTNKMDMS